MTTEQRIRRARSALILDHPWFGSLSLRLTIEAKPDVTDTMATNGTVIAYDPAWVDTVTDETLRGVIAHEVMHCALLHPYRVGKRSPDDWNIAADLAINPLLLDAGFKLPDGALIDPQYKGMSAEDIYSRRKAKKAKGEGDGLEPQPGGVNPAPAQGKGKGKPGKNGKPDPAPNGPEDWQIATAQATMVSEKAGKTPGGADRAAHAARQPSVDWKEALREFVSQTMPTDQSWARPNRRHIAAGLYLPGTVKEGTARLMIGIDTSGSISAAMLETFATELTAILHDCRPEALDVRYFDTDIQHQETFTPEDDRVTLKARGGGGTEFDPILAHARDADEPPVALVVFTDLYGNASIDPGLPVLWIVTPGGSHTPPRVGRVLRMSEE